jgi:hypothetical protein
MTKRKNILRNRNGNSLSKIKDADPADIYVSLVTSSLCARLLQPAFSTHTAHLVRQNVREQLAALTGNVLI